MTNEQTIPYTTAFTKLALEAGTARVRHLWVILRDEHERDPYRLRPAVWQGTGEYQAIEFDDGTDCLVKTPDGHRWPMTPGERAAMEARPVDVLERHLKAVESTVTLRVDGLANLLAANPSIDDAAVAVAEEVIEHSRNLVRLIKERLRMMGDGTI